MTTRIKSIILAASAILIAMVNASTVSAESHISDFIKDGTMWISKTSSHPLNLNNDSDNLKEPYKTIRYISGTTVINGVEYMRLFGGFFQFFNEYEEDFSFENVSDTDSIDLWNMKGLFGPVYGNLLALLRIENGKIYIYNLDRKSENDLEEILYYDYNLQKGDIISIKDCNFYYNDLTVDRRKWDVKCVGKGTVTSCGNTFDLLYMSYETGIPGSGQYNESMPNACWIDCIGADNYMMSGSDNLRLGNPAHILFGNMELETMICDGKVVYRSSDFTEENITKPDFSNIGSLEGDEAAVGNSPVYSIDGTPAHPDSSGIKISNGKKYMTSGK